MTAPLPPPLGPLFGRLSDEAERARWIMSDIPWDAIARERVTPRLVAVVRAAALSELTTWSASRRFLDAFADDVDFTQWVAVWFFEETRHPQALLRWLAAVGETVDDAAIRRARVASPFMRSRTGMLVTNVISEVIASGSYLHLSRHAGEPVLARIAQCLAADEARHASGFLSYAARAIAMADRPDEERLVALKVLYLWLSEQSAVGHPVNELHQGLARDELPDGEAVPPLDFAPLRRRACALVSGLVGESLVDESGVREAVKRRAAAQRESA